MLKKAFEATFLLNEKGLSQKLIIKLMAQPFAMQFCAFRQNKKSLKMRQKRV